jgi:hypothetical protein
MAALTERDRITKDTLINKEQRLYVHEIRNDKGKVTGYTCTGFDVLHNRTTRLIDWLTERGYDAPKMPKRKGTKKAYFAYLAALDRARAATISSGTGMRCTAELTPQLQGLEGKRVEVETSYGEIRRFYVGRSTGWMPIHLEISRRDSTGGTGAERQYKRITVIR